MGAESSICCLRDVGTAPWRITSLRARHGRGLFEVLFSLSAYIVLSAVERSVVRCVPYPSTVKLYISVRSYTQ